MGIDLGLDGSEALVIDSQARQLDRLGFPHSRHGYDYLLRRLKAIRDKHQSPAVLVGMEPTNYFWKLRGLFRNILKPRAITFASRGRRYQVFSPLNGANILWLNGLLTSDFCQSRENLVSFVKRQLKMDIDDN